MVEYDVHDNINLHRLVRKLEQSISNKDAWDESRGERVWLKALGTLQKVKHARKLLRNVETFEVDMEPEKIRRFEDMRIVLDSVETFAKAVENRTTPKPVRPEPLLPQIPIPTPPQTEKAEVPSSTNGAASSIVSEPDTATLLPADELLPADTASSAPASTILIPSSFPSSPAQATTSTTKATATGASARYLQNTNALHTELSEQLAQMATQLKRNAMHFSESLAKDKAVVEETQEKLESNFDVMQKERIRLRDHRGKSGSTTCLVVLIVIAVLLLFVLMVMVIRFTRR